MELDLMVASFCMEYVLKSFTTWRNLLLYVGNFDTLLIIPIILQIHSSIQNMNIQNYRRNSCFLFGWLELEYKQNFIPSTNALDLSSS